MSSSTLDDESRNEGAGDDAPPAPAARTPAASRTTAWPIYVAPKGTADWTGAFAVTAGLGIEKKLAEFEATHDDYRAIMLKSLADRLAEACAEWLHERVRKELLGLCPPMKLSNDS